MINKLNWHCSAAFTIFFLIKTCGLSNSTDCSASPLMGSLKGFLSAGYLDGQPFTWKFYEEVIDSSSNRIFRLRFGVSYNSNIFLYLTFCMQSHPSVQQQQIPLGLAPWKLQSPPSATWPPGSTAKHVSPQLIVRVTFPSGLGCNSFPAAANAVRQSHRQCSGSEPRVGILFPCTWPMLHLLAVSKQQILPFHSLPLLLSKQLLLPK